MKPKNLKEINEAFTLQAPSCRNNDIGYIPNETFVCTVDGFLTTKNVRVLSHSTVVTSK